LNIFEYVFKYISLYLIISESIETYLDTFEYI